MNLPDWQSKSPEDVLAYLSAESILYEDHQLWTWAGIAQVTGDEGASALCNKLIELNKLWAVHQLGGAGLDLANDEIQQQLYYMHSIGVPGMADLASSVKRYYSPLVYYNISADISVVTQTMQELLNPPVPDEISHEILLSANRQSNGELNVFASVTKVYIRDGNVISKDPPVTIVNGDLRLMIQPIIEGLNNG